MKAKTFLAACTAALTAVAAVAAPYEIKISDGRPDAMYKLGETCRFRLTARDLATNDVSRGGVVKVKIDNFGERVFATREWDPAAEPVLEMSGTMKDPGFLRVVAMSAPRQAGALWALGKGNACWSVGFEPERIRPGSARPADFDAYWDGERARLAREVPSDFRRERVDWLCDGGFEVWKVSCATFGGKRTWGFLVAPKDLSSGPLPLYVNVPGAGPALSEAGTRHFMKPGEIHLVVNVHPYEPAKDAAGQKRLYDAQGRECAKKYGCNYAIAGGAVSREEFFFHDALLGIDRVVAWVASLPEVDRGRVRYSGGSQGGGMGIALCALNPAIGRAVFMVPAMTDLCGFRAGRQSGWPLLVERQKTPAAKSAAEAIAPYFDAAHFAPRVRIPLRIEAGLSDTTCPPPCVYATFNAFGSSDKKAVNSIGCGHSGSKENRAKLAAWLREKAALSPAAVSGGFRPVRVVYGDKGLFAKSMASRLAGELARAAERVTGHPCAAERESVGGEPATGTIYVGPTEAAARAGFDVSALPALGARIVVTNGVAFILARTTTACAYGISDFAARLLGYHFVTFDGDDPFECSPGLEIADCDFTAIPAIYYRRVYAVDKYKRLPELKRDWAMRHLLFKTDVIEADLDGADRLSERTHPCHSQFDYVPPETYFESHPEYYSLGKDGKRHGVRNRRSHLCLTNPDVERIVWSNLVSFIEADRREKPSGYPCIYDFSQMDAAPDFCRCEACAAVAAKYDAKGGRTDGGDAGLQLEFVNRIARKLKAAYPDVMLRIFAYVSTEVPPKGRIRPEDNVIVWLCDLYTTSDHEVPLTHPANAPRLGILREWAKIARNIEIWDYMLYGELSDRKGGHADFPEVNVDAIAADARLFRDMGVKRLFMECEYRDQPFHELNIHALGTFYCDPDADVEKVVSEYCRVYGGAAGKMREAIDLVRRLQLSAPATETQGFRWHRRDLAWLTVANLERVWRLMKEAEALADTPGAKKRVAHALRSTENKLSLLRKCESGDAECVFAAESFGRANLCRFVDDPAAAEGRAVEVLHRDAIDAKKPVKPALPLQMGVYDWDTKGNEGLSLSPVVSQGYAWYKVGEAYVPPAGTIWLSKDWGVTVDLRSCHAKGDGLPEDYNRFDFYVSAKYTGERLFIDRVRLVRKIAIQAKPEKGEK